MATGLQNGMYFVNPHEDDPYKSYYEELLSQQFIPSSPDIATELFTSNETLCPGFGFKENIESAISGGKYATLFYVENRVMVCIMTVNFDLNENEETDTITGIDSIKIVYYCCAPNSKKSKILIHHLQKLLPKAPVYVESTEESDAYWSKYGTRMSANNYKLTPVSLGGSKKKLGKMKSKRLRKRLVKSKRKYLRS